MKQAANFPILMMLSFSTGPHGTFDISVELARDMKSVHEPQQSSRCRYSLQPVFVCQLLIENTVAWGWTDFTLAATTTRTLKLGPSWLPLLHQRNHCRWHAYLLQLGMSSLEILRVVHFYSHGLIFASGRSSSFPFKHSPQVEFFSRLRVSFSNYQWHCIWNSSGKTSAVTSLGTRPRGHPLFHNLSSYYRES